MGPKYSSPETSPSPIGSRGLQALPSFQSLVTAAPNSGSLNPGGGAEARLPDALTPAAGSPWGDTGCPFHHKWQCALPPDPARALGPRYSRLLAKEPNNRLPFWSGCVPRWQSPSRVWQMWSWTKDKYSFEETARGFLPALPTACSSRQVMPHAGVGEGTCHEARHTPTRHRTTG